jgi:hypothetical protein
MYATNCEKAGKPSVGLGFADQINFARNVALVNGVPNFRWIDVPRVGSGAERVATFIDKIPAALIDPLTAKEKEAGLYTPPEPPRVVFEGTLDDAQNFFQKTTPVMNCGNCPIAQMTDGLPIIIPTEAKVKEMLTGTSHKPEEDIYRYSMNTTTQKITKATTVVTYARGYKSTVEKVAVIAVMSGCKPEYLPAVLAIATSGGGSTNCPGTSGAGGNCFVASGPFAKEVGMNARQEAFDVGNPPNMTLQRSANLITVNFGACITGVTRTDSGNPFRNWTFAEDTEALPPGWETLGEELGYKKTDSLLSKVGIHEGATVQEYAPSSFRGLIADGYGGMARRVGKEGVPGPHNFLEYVMPIYLTASPNGLLASRILLMHPNMAKSLYDFGFKTKMSVYQWIFDTYKVPASLVKNSGWFEFGRSGGESLFTMPDGSRVKWKDAPDNFMVPAFGTSVTSNQIIVCISNADEMMWTLFGSRGGAYPIDPWR